MATTMTLPNNPIKSKPWTTKCLKTAGFHRTACASGRKLYSRCSFVHVAEPFLAKNFRRVWQIKSSVDSNGLDPTSSSSDGGGTRLVRAIQAFRTRLGARIREIRKTLPMKLLFFLVGFYCATAFATVIGQTGDWDILSAALAVVVVEWIGALMYRASFPLVKSIRNIISMFNYWKAGLTVGLFLDSFKYEIDKIMSFSNLFGVEMDIVCLFLWVLKWILSVCFCESCPFQMLSANVVCT